MQNLANFHVTSPSYDQHDFSLCVNQIWLWKYTHYVSESDNHGIAEKQSLVRFVRVTILANVSDVKLLRDKQLQELVETYAENTPKLHGKTRHPHRPKLAEARSEAPRPILRAACVAFFRAISG